MKFLNTTEDGVPKGPTGSKVIRVIVADSQGIFSVGIGRILAFEDDIRLIGRPSSLEELFITIGEQQPIDVALVEGELLSGTPGSIAELQRTSPGIKLIVQATAVNKEQTLELYRSGIRGVISRSISPDLLVRCVRRINAGETWIDNQGLEWVISAYRASDPALRTPRSKPQLSLRETVIITCITQGMHNKEIAFQLGTTDQVVKNYLRKIYEKLGVTDRLELAILSVQKKIAMADGVPTSLAAYKKA